MASNARSYTTHEENTPFCHSRFNRAKLIRSRGMSQKAFRFRVLTTLLSKATPFAQPWLHEMNAFTITTTKKNHNAGV